MAAADVSDKTGDEIAQELLLADIALGQRMQAKQLLHQLQCSADLVPVKAPLEEQLRKLIEAREMGPFYKEVLEKLDGKRDDALASSIEAKNAQKLTEFDAKIAKNKEEFGDAEVFDASCAKAEYLAQIGATTEAVAAYDAVDLAHTSSGQRVDILMGKALAHLFAEEFADAKTAIDAANANRLKVYLAVQRITQRDFEGAAPLLLDVISTFTCYEICDYNTFVFYTVLMAMVTLPRIQLKARVVDSPDILSVILDIPHLSELLNCYYSSDYAGFMIALVRVNTSVQMDRYLAPHAAFFVREVRVRAYGQYLEAFRSVTTATMAQAFGVNQKFLDAELSRFIAARRLHAKIDKMGGVIETTRAAEKTAQYKQVLKTGDALLNRVQRLSRVVSV